MLSQDIAMQPDPDRYHLRLAAAMVRGRATQDSALNLPKRLQNSPLHRLTNRELAQIFSLGAAAGLRLHRFKLTMQLPRVARVFGMLRSLMPENLLDVGSGRGVFLWPLLDEFPDLPVTAVDLDPRRARDLDAVRRGGVERLAACEMDATDLTFNDNSFDLTTLLEVLEHIPSAEQAVAESVRVSRRFVIVSVPSKPDDNPQHIHLLDEATLRRWFAAAGVERVNFDYAPGHLLAVAKVAG